MREGSGAQALFGAGDHFVWVKLGQEAAAGFQSIDVRTDRVIVKEDDTGHELEISLWSEEASGTPALISRSRQAKSIPSPTSPKRRALEALEALSVTPNELDRLNQEAREKFLRARASNSPREREKRNRRNPREDQPEEE